MELNFIKLSPTQNMTILVESEVPRALHGKAAEALMAYDNVYAEQVGYIEKPSNEKAWSRLQMMGGEFCGNATLSLAALLVSRKSAGDGEKVNVPLEVSGYDGIVDCVIEVKGGKMLGTLNMPTPEKIVELKLPLDGHDYSFTVVYLPGITYFIVPDDELHLNAVEFAEKAVEQWNPLIKEDTFGIILLDRAKLSIRPLIHVRSANSLVWERGCGSGTAATGAYLAVKSGNSVDERIGQPGGVIKVQASLQNGGISAISVTGEIKIVARGTAYIDI